MALSRNELLKELLPSLNTLFNAEYHNYEEAFKLYNHVVHIERQKVEITTLDRLPVSRAVTTPYRNLEEVPEELRNKIKRLMWCTSSDVQDGLGVKVNDATYWVS